MAKMKKGMAEGFNDVAQMVFNGIAMYGFFSLLFRWFKNKVLSPDERLGLNRDLNSGGNRVYKVYINNKDVSSKVLTKNEAFEVVKSMAKETHDPNSYFTIYNTGTNTIEFRHSVGTGESIDEGWGGAIAGAIGGGMIGGPVGAAVGGLAGYALGGSNDSPEEAYELGQQAARNGYSKEHNPYGEDWTGSVTKWLAWNDGWTDARGEYEDDEDDEDEPTQVPPTKQSSAPVAVTTKTTAPTKISGPADFSKRGFTGYKKPGDMEEGFRVPAQQILGTKNRAKSAYYPTNVKPKVPKLDKPLTDQELARLTQLAGIKANK
jgi:hypothetical protein